MKLLGFCEESKYEANECFKFEIDQHWKQKQEKKYEEQITEIASYCWINECDKYMIGTPSDAGTKKCLDKMEKTRARAKIFISVAQYSTPLLILVWQIFRYFS